MENEQVIADFMAKGKANAGYCPACERETVFIEYEIWKRDHYRCNYCGSLPRNRALMMALNLFFPDWPTLTIHESSPDGPVYKLLKTKCKGYSASYYYQDIAPGKYKNGFRSENLEKMTFPSSSFDLFITQDVFEHVMNPLEAFAEIARVLKPGGAHIFTIP